MIMTVIIIRIKSFECIRLHVLVVLDNVFDSVNLKAKNYVFTLYPVV